MLGVRDLRSIRDVIADALGRAATQPCDSHDTSSQGRSVEGALIQEV